MGRREGGSSCWWAGPTEQGHGTLEGVAGRSEGSLLCGSLPQLGGTSSRLYETWPPQTIKQTPFTLLDFSIHFFSAANYPKAAGCIARVTPLPRLKHMTRC